jgi:DNA primase
MLTEEGFEIRIVTLEGGLDPDRYVRERGVQAYVEALRSAQRLPEYLIERARTLFPPRTAEAKVKALNYLLPRIRRLPNRLSRDEFAADAAQKLGIDSAVMREELKQAAAKRRDQVPQASPVLNECERVLLRALASHPESAAFICVARALEDQPSYFESLTAPSMLRNLAGRGAIDPLDVFPEGASRTLLAQLLMNESEPVTSEEVNAAIATARQSYLERRQRELRSAIAEAEKRGDWGQVATLTAEKLALDRKLREV